MSAVEVFQLPEAGERVYVIAYGSGIVKVGYTAKPRQRMITLRRDARSLGDRVTHSWLADEHANARANERALIAFCERHGARPGNVDQGDYFQGVQYSDVVAYAETLPKQPVAITQRAPGDHDECDACDWVHKFPFTSWSLMHEVHEGKLLLIEADSGRPVNLDTLYWRPSDQQLELPGGVR